MHAAHHDAALARARAHPKLAGKTYSGIREDQGDVRENGVAIATTIGGYEKDRNTSGVAPDGDAFLMVRARIVATSFDGVLVLREAVDQQFAGHHLDVTGRACTPFDPFADDPVYDPATQMWRQDVVFEATTSRAA